MTFCEQIYFRCQNKVEHLLPSEYEMWFVIIEKKKKKNHKTKTIHNSQHQLPLIDCWVCWLDDESQTMAHNEIANVAYNFCSEHITLYYRKFMMFTCVYALKNYCLFSLKERKIVQKRDERETEIMKFIPHTWFFSIIYIDDAENNVNVEYSHRLFK